MGRLSKLLAVVYGLNMLVQLVGGAVFVALIDLVLMARIRLGWRIGAPDQPWPLWLMLAIPAGVTLAWLLIAVIAVLHTYREWHRVRQPE